MNPRDILLALSLLLTSISLYGLYQARERLYLEPELAAERRWAGTNGEVNRLLENNSRLHESFKEVQASNNELWRKFKELEGATGTISRFIDANSLLEWNRKFAELDAKWSSYQLALDKVINQDGTLKDLSNRYVTREEYWKVGSRITDLESLTYNLKNRIGEKETLVDKAGQQFEALKKVVAPLQEAIVPAIDEGMH